MPYTRAKPVSACESSEPSDEASKLEIYLQRQLEEDVARIFDESIYTDLEVVCGKLKILTHSCILKARTDQFYRKLKTILHVNIGRDTFDEIYSFISDAYTECDINNQEREIITYLQKNLQVFKSNHSVEYKVKDQVELEVSSKCVNLQRIKSNPLVINKARQGEIESDVLLTDKCVQNLKSKPITTYKQREEKIDLDVFLTPKCISPYSDKIFNKGAVLSPSTELTKEYYALVPIEGNLLEQELNEQDALSTAFQSIIKTQDNKEPKTPPNSKPTSLYLSSSHFPKTVKHSNSCDNIHKSNFGNENLCFHNDLKRNLRASQEKKGNHSIDSEKPAYNSLKSCSNYSSGLETLVDPTYSPDSLIADDPSSSSDYLSAAYAGSPGLGSSGFFQLNVGNNTTKMENIFNSSDSGLDNTGLLESLNSHKDVTLADVSLTESTLHEFTGDEIQSHEAACSSDKHQKNKFKVRTSRSDSSPLSGTSSEKSGFGLNQSPNKAKDVIRSSKEEKQRQNEEIVILESSSVSSETGSWESVFPPRMAEKEICETFINMERQFSCSYNTIDLQRGKNNIITEEVSRSNITDQMKSSKIKSLPHKSSACFIDAASLVDEEDIKIELTEEITRKSDNRKIRRTQPVPCSVVNKHDISPNDWSESNENDDSLEHTQDKDQNSAQRDLSPTIFEMTPITEDSLTTNLFENNTLDEVLPSVESQGNYTQGYICFKKHKDLVSSTPHNSIISFNSNVQIESEENEYALIQSRDNPTKLNRNWSEGSKYNDSFEQTQYKDQNSAQRNLPPTIFETPPLNEDVPCKNPSIAPLSTPSVNLTNLKRNESETIYEVSLEQTQHKNQNPAQTIMFEMTPSTADSFSTNRIEKNKNDAVQPPVESEANYTQGCLSFKDQHGLVTSTPYDIISSRTASVKSEEIEYELSQSPDFLIKLRKTRCNESSPIVSGGASIEDGHVSRRSPVNDSNKPQKASSASAWVVDMSLCPVESNLHFKKPSDKACESLKQESQFDNSENCNKSRGSVDSDTSDKSGHKFYIDLSSLPDPLPKNNDTGSTTEKKNMFSIYIDLSDKSELKEMPSRLSSLNTKKQIVDKCTIKPPKVIKAPLSECIIPTFPKIFEQSSTASAFEKFECLCNNPDITISEIIAISNDTSKSKKMINEENNGDTDTGKILVNSKSVDGESVFSTASNISLKNPSNDHTSDLFVKLSDLDKPVYKPELPVLIHEYKDALGVRMTRSIPENNWGEQNHAVSSRSIEVISSFHSENALSLNRLFPHLKNEFSKSMPGSLSGRAQSPIRQGLSSSPGEPEEQISDASEMSSVQSSICRSVVENSTTETSQTSSLIGNCQSRLGQDLLRMFLEEIAPDVIVEVSGKRIKAHKCILSSRCQYFAGILSGGWVESAGNVIVMPPFSFNVVHFALCHIYSGLSNIPDSVSIVELATIADMLGLEGLKEAIMFTLKAKYCHHFHRPCQVCTAGVVECFPLSSVYGLDDLYRKCLRWITKYFSKVWPTKTFATLPKELLDKCYQEHIVNLTIENVIDTVYGCGVTVTSLENTRWAETVARMCRRLVNAAAHFAAPRLVAVLRAVGATTPDVPHAAKQALDDCLTAAIEWAPPDETCRAYAFLSNLLKEMRNQHLYKPDIINNSAPNKMSPQHNLLVLHASSWRLQLEGALVRGAPRVVGTQAFKDLPSDLRKRLRELGCIMYGAQAVAMNTSPFKDRKSRSAYTARTNISTVRPTAATSQSFDMEHVRTSFVPYKPKPPVQIASNDKIKSNSELRDVKQGVKLNPPKVRTTKAQEQRAKFNQKKTDQAQERVVKNKIPVRANAFENTKPRYLEPRPGKEAAKKEHLLKPKTIFFTSSESSRNSSPVLARNIRTSRSKGKTQAMSQDSLATTSRPRTAEPSTDSLSESQNSNKYGTYTKIKHTSKGSVESVKSPKYQNAAGPSGITNKVKTKIPVYANKAGPIILETKDNNFHKRYPVCPQSKPNNTSSAPKTKTDRKLPGSLMMATKSSSAKVVPKLVRDPQAAKATKQTKTIKNSVKSEERDRSADIPVMGRSGTFLKDEPMFGDKTIEFDVGP